MPGASIYPFVHNLVPALQADGLGTVLTYAELLVGLRQTAAAVLRAVRNNRLPLS